MKKIIKRTYLLNQAVFNVFRYGLLPMPKFYSNSVMEQKSLYVPHSTMGKSIKNFLQNSGPLYIKLGQILALREDLFSSQICNELSDLFEKQEAMKFKEVKKILKKNRVDLNKFISIKSEALAVGSIGQVHEAELQDGKKVILKVKRKNIAKKLQRDEDSIKAFIEVFLELGPEKHQSQVQFLQKMVAQMIESVKEELDFNNESDSLQKFRKRFFKNSKIVIPKVFEEFSNENVIVMEKLEGISLVQFKEKKSSSEKEKKEIADLIFKEIMTEVFHYGKFHADPHAGNFIVMDDGKIGLIDLGLTGSFSKKDRSLIVKSIKNLLAKDIDGTIQTLLEFGELPEDFAYEPFKEDIRKIFYSFKENEDKKLDILVSNLFSCADQYKIFIPRDIGLFIKTMVTTEGLAKSLDPSFKAASKALPIILSSWVRKYLSI